MSIKTNATNTRFGKQSAYIVSLNRDTCEKCKKQAYDEALQAKKSRQWLYVFVQFVQSGDIEVL